MKNLILFVICAIFLQLPAQGQIIITIVGNGTAGYNGDGGVATAAQLNHASFITFDASGNLFISDYINGRIRKVSTTGIISTVAGNGTTGYAGDGGPATDAQINRPIGIVVDGTGNIYIADDFNHRIRKINTAGIITTIAGTGIAGFNGDGIATAVQINSPHGIAIDGLGNLLFTDCLNNRVRKISATGIITTIAGISSSAGGGDGGPATTAGVFSPYGIAIGGSGNIYFTQYGDHIIRKITASGIISTIAGTGTVGFSGDGNPATSAALRGPTGIAVDAAENIYFSDCNNYRIRRINTMNIINTIAGTGVNGDGPDGTIATLTNIGGALGVCAYNGNVYFSDFDYGRIRTFKNTVAVKDVNSISGSFNCYPNPSNGTFTIHISSPADEEVPVIVANTAGLVVHEFTVHTNEPLSISLNVPAGLYLISALANVANHTGKIIINK